MAVFLLVSCPFLLLAQAANERTESNRESMAGPSRQNESCDEWSRLLQQINWVHLRTAPCTRVIKANWHLYFFLFSLFFKGWFDLQWRQSCPNRTRRWRSFRLPFSNLMLSSNDATQRCQRRNGNIGGEILRACAPFYNQVDILHVIKSLQGNGLVTAKFRVNEILVHYRRAICVWRTSQSTFDSLFIKREDGDVNLHSK